VIAIDRLSAPRIEAKAVHGRWGTNLSDISPERVLSPKDVRFQKAGDGRIALTVRLSARQLPNAATYVYAIRPGLTAASFDLPAWCRDWSLDSGAAFDGAKTLNLHEFVNGVWAAYLRECQPALGCVHFYLKN
jgi:hypothetical protein